MTFLPARISARRDVAQEITQQAQLESSRESLESKIVGIAEISTPDPRQNLGAQVGARPMVRGGSELEFLDRVQSWHAEGGNLEAEWPRHGHLTGMCLAADNNWLSVIRWLADHGASLDALPPQLGWRPVHYATFKGHYDAVALLLKLGARVDGLMMSRENSGDQYGNALHCLRNGDVLQTCKLLLSHGAPYNERDEVGNDPETRLRARYFGIYPPRAEFLKAANLIAEVSAAGGWSLYVGAPRAELLKLRRALPTLRNTPNVPLYTRLFLYVPEDVFVEVFAFWRSPRDL